MMCGGTRLRKVIYLIKEVLPYLLIFSFCHLLIHLFRTENPKDKYHLNSLLNKEMQEIVQN